MRKHIINKALVPVLILYFLGSVVYATGDKTSGLKRKMGENASLQTLLSGKINQATEKRDRLTQKMEELKGEIKQETEQWQIESYRKALQNARIDYNLKLIQLLLGYTSGLTQKIIYFQNGLETLDFFLRQAQDDLLIIKTLNNLEIDKLIAQINSVLDEYVPETGEPMFDAGDIPLEDTEKIWNDIMTGKKRSSAKRN